ncbi:hypothetical protein ACFL2Q_14715 [Thermodesulfobacteriota bacterium]
MSKLSKEKLEERFREALLLFDADNQAIAEDLNEEGVLTSTGKKWTKSNVSAYKTRLKQKDEKQAESGKDARLPEHTKDLPKEDVEEGKTMVESPKELPKEEAIEEKKERLPSPTNDLPISIETAKGLAELYESGALQELIAWKEEQMQVQKLEIRDIRPMFKTAKKKNTGIYIDAEILKRAEEKMKQERVQTGGSLSKLVELLLWQYVGSPDDVLESSVQGSLLEETEEG